MALTAHTEQRAEPDRGGCVRSAADCASSRNLVLPTISVTPDFELPPVTPADDRDRFTHATSWEGLLGTSTLTGALVAGLTARRIGDRIGGARALVGAAVLYGLAYQLYPFTGHGWALACYVVAGFFASFGVIVLNVFGMSFQQAAAPPGLLGRVNSITHTLVFGAIPLGSLAGGALASAFGMRVTLHVAAAGVLGSAAILVCSPLRKLRDLVPR